MEINNDLPSCGKLPIPTLIAENGRQVLDARYLKKDREGAAESPEEMFHRVAREITRIDIGCAVRANSYHLVILTSAGTEIDHNGGHVIRSTARIRRGNKKLA